MTPPPPNEIARLRELLAKATPGPWIADDAVVYTEHKNWLRQAVADTEESAEMFNPYGMAHDASATNAELIVSAVNALPSLLDTAERAHDLEAENKRLREMLERGLRAVNAAYQQAQAEYHNHDIKADKLDKIVCDWRNEARAALKGEGA